MVLLGQDEALIQTCSRLGLEKKPWMSLTECHANKRHLNTVNNTHIKLRSHNAFVTDESNTLFACVLEEVFHKQQLDVKREKKKNRMNRRRPLARGDQAY